MIYVSADWAPMMPGWKCRLGLHDWKRWYSGWEAPDGILYDLRRCIRPDCKAIESSYVQERRSRIGMTELAIMRLNRLNRAS